MKIHNRIKGEALWLRLFLQGMMESFSVFGLKEGQQPAQQQAEKP